jgi:hypothetical protein
MADNRNISSLVNTNTLNNLSKSNRPKSFGDQSSNPEKLVNSSLGKKQELQIELKKLVVKEIEEKVKYGETLLSLYKQYQPSPPTKPTLTFEQYEQKKIEAEVEYTNIIIEIDLQKNEINKQIQDISKDPYQNIKNIRNATTSDKIIGGLAGAAVLAQTVGAGVSGVQSVAFPIANAISSVNATARAVNNLRSIIGR